MQPATHPLIVTEEQLKTLSGYERRSDLREWLERNGIRYTVGKAIKAAAFDTAWQRLMGKAMEAGLRERFTFHDLKAKGVTDHAEQWAGHRSERMRQVYVRKAREIQATR